MSWGEMAKRLSHGRNPQSQPFFAAPLHGEPAMSLFCSRHTHTRRCSNAARPRALEELFADSNERKLGCDCAMYPFNFIDPSRQEKSCRVRTVGCGTWPDSRRIPRRPPLRRPSAGQRPRLLLARRRPPCPRRQQKTQIDPSSLPAVARSLLAVSFPGQSKQLQWLNRLRNTPNLRSTLFEVVVAARRTPHTVFAHRVRPALAARR